MCRTNCLVLDIDLRELYVDLSVYSDQGLIWPVQASSTISMEVHMGGGGGLHPPLRE